jgi:hypothetical protein
MDERVKDLGQEPEKAPPARATDPQKPGEPLRPGAQPDPGTAGAAAGTAAGGASPRSVETGRGDARDGGPDDRGRKQGDREGL